MENEIRKRIKRSLLGIFNRVATALGRKTFPASVLHGRIAYEDDGMVLSQVPGFLDDVKFQRALDLAYKCSRITGPWRVHIYCWFGKLASHLDGDFVECGVNLGSYARALIEFADLSNRSGVFHLLDTFEGLDSRQISDEERSAGIEFYLDKYTSCYESVKKTFDGLPVNIIKGRIPETLEKCAPSKVAFLSIDMNCVEPEIAALRHFWHRMVPGGIILLDDYGFPRHVNQRKAHEQFAKSNNRELLILPTGQAVMVK